MDATTQSKEESAVDGELPILKEAGDYLAMIVDQAKNAPPCLEISNYVLATAQTLPAEVDFQQVKLKDFNPCYSYHMGPDGLKGVVGVGVWEWENHYGLDWWMEQRYLKRGGKGRDENYGRFDCVALALTADDIDQLDADVVNLKLPAKPEVQKELADGVYAYNKYKMYTDIRFINRAKSLLSDGLNIYYYTVHWG